MKIAIIGAGISGLTAAYDLEKAASNEIVLIEQSATVGGKIQTAQVGDYLVEQGPDSIFATKPWAVDIICELGMEADLMEPLCSEFSILTKGKLHTVPRALASLIPSASGALEKAGFLSAAAKRRALKEADVEAGGGHDESISSFFGRRFGRSFSNLVAEPLLAGTHAGDPTKLSMAALYPTYVGMEQSHGSISKAAAERASHAAPSHAPRRAGFLTLKGGMASLPMKVAGALTSTKLLTSTSVESVTLAGSRVLIESSGGRFEVDHVIIATPAYVTAGLLKDACPEAAALLSDIRFVSTAIASLAYPRDAFPKPLHGNGFLVPYTEHSAITGCTWSSNKWAERAPDDMLLIRAFMGRDGGLSVDEHSDDELVAKASDALGSILSPSVGPAFTRLDRWTRGMAQYEIGHLARIAAIDKAVAGLPVSLVGSSYRGNSISDCVRQGREIAAQLLSL